MQGLCCTSCGDSVHRCLSGSWRRKGHVPTGVTRGKDTDGGRMLSVGVKSQLQKSLHRDSSWVMVWETRRAHDLGKQCSKVRDQLVQCFVESRGSTRHS